MRVERIQIRLVTPQPGTVIKGDKLASTVLKLKTKEGHKIHKLNAKFTVKIPDYSGCEGCQMELSTRAGMWYGTIESVEPDKDCNQVIEVYANAEGIYWWLVKGLCAFGTWQIHPIITEPLLGGTIVETSLAGNWAIKWEEYSYLKNYVEVKVSELREQIPNELDPTEIGLVKRVVGELEYIRLHRPNLYSKLTQH